MMTPAFTPGADESLCSGLTGCSEDLEEKRLQKCKFFLQSTTPTKYRCCVIIDSRHWLLQAWSEGTNVLILVFSPIYVSARVRFQMYFSSEWISPPFRLAGYVKWPTLLLLTSVVLWVYGWRQEFLDDLIKTDPGIMGPVLSYHSKQGKLFFYDTYSYLGRRHWSNEKENLLKSLPDGSICL